MDNLISVLNAPGSSKSTLEALKRVRSRSTAPVRDAKELQAIAAKIWTVRARSP